MAKVPKEIRAKIHQELDHGSDIDTIAKKFKIAVKDVKRYARRHHKKKV